MMMPRPKKHECPYGTFRDTLVRALGEIQRMQSDPTSDYKQMLFKGWTILYCPFCGIELNHNFQGKDAHNFDHKPAV